VLLSKHNTIKWKSGLNAMNRYHKHQQREEGFAFNLFYIFNRVWIFLHFYDQLHLLANKGLLCPSEKYKAICHQSLHLVSSEWDQLIQTGKSALYCYHYIDFIRCFPCREHFVGTSMPVNLSRLSSHCQNDVGSHRCNDLRYHCCL
jgi:hypothetical protein